MSFTSRVIANHAELPAQWGVQAPADVVQLELAPQDAALIGLAAEVSDP